MVLPASYCHAALLALAACSDVSGPQYDDTIAARLSALAPRCTTEPHPNGPGGYDAEVTCRSDEAIGTMVHVLIEDKRIGELAVTLEEPTVDAAIGKIGPALEGVCNHAELDAIASGLRGANPMTGGATTQVKGRGKPRVGVAPTSPGGPVTVSVTFDYRKD